MVDCAARVAVVGFMRYSGVLPAMPGSGMQDIREDVFARVFARDTDYNSARDLSRPDHAGGPAQPHPHHAEPHEERPGATMDDLTRNATGGQKVRPRLDLQEHLADLEARGLLTRIDHPVNKDTELHPLVRLQFLGGIPEAERRAFLFTNVVDAAGRRYDIPVVVGAIAASAEIYALGMGRKVAE